MTRGSSAQPSVLPDSLAENPIGSETLINDRDSLSQVTCQTGHKFFKSKVKFHDPQVGASCNDAAEANSALCSLKVNGQRDRPSVSEHPISLSLIPLPLWVILPLTSPSFEKMTSDCGSSWWRTSFP